MLVRSFGWEIDESKEIFTGYYDLKSAGGIYNAAIYSGMPYNLKGIDFDLSSIYNSPDSASLQSPYDWEDKENEVAMYEFKLSGFSSNEIPLECEIDFWGEQLCVTRIDIDWDSCPIDTTTVNWDEAPRHMWPIDIDKQEFLVEYAAFLEYLQQTTTENSE